MIPRKRWDGRPGDTSGGAARWPAYARSAICDDLRGRLGPSHPAGIRDMDFIHELKRERAQKKSKRLLLPGLFPRVGGLVRMCSLGRGFLETLDALSDEPPPGALRVGHVKAKPEYRPPLFPLITQEEYRVTMAILDKLRNPYLAFANSPDEILLCRALFRRNPLLASEELASTHFGTLLLAQSAEASVEDSKPGEARRDG